MKFGVSTFVWVSPFSSESFDLLLKVKDMGYDMLEVAIEDRNLIDFKQLKAAAQEIGLELGVSGAFGPNRDISSDDPEVRAEGLAYIIDCLELANFLESPVFGGPVYSAVGKARLLTEEQKQQERNWCLENLEKAISVAEKQGVIIGFEPLNRFESDMVNTVDQALTYIDAFNSPFLKVQLDTFHNNIEEKDIPTAIRKLGNKLCHVQGNESDRGTPGTGNVDWMGIRDALVEIDYQGAIVIETFGAPSKEMARAASIWRPLANSADELAKEGLAFFKGLFPN